NVQAPTLVCKFPDCPTDRVDPSGDKAGGATDAFHPEPFHSDHWPCELSAYRFPPFATSSLTAEPLAANWPFSRIKLPERFAVVLKDQVPALLTRLTVLLTVKVEPSGDMVIMIPPDHLRCRYTG